MRKLLVILGITVATALLAFGWLRQHEITHAQKEFHLGMLLGEQNGYILTPPEFVAQPFIRRIEWSPDGNYALLLQTVVQLKGSGQDLHADLRHRVLTWNRKTKRLSVLWESERTETEIEPQRDVQVAFFKGAPACLLALREGKWKSDEDDEAYYLWTVYYAPLNGRTVKLGNFEHASLLAPPEDEQRYLIWSQLNPETNQASYLYAPISPTGKLEAPRPLPASALSLYYYGTVFDSDRVRWYVDGKQAVISVFLPEERSEGQSDLPIRYRVRHLLWDPRTNQAREMDTAEVRPYEPPPRQTTLYVTHSQQPLRHKEAQSAIQLTWLGEGEALTLVAADSALAKVSPQGDALLYVAHGTAFYRALHRVDRDLLRQLVEQIRREKYLSQANRIARALLMYIQDYDECFPPNYGDMGVAEAIWPYLRHREDFEVEGNFAFRYLMDGQNIASLESPSHTVVGYLELPEGRIAIYGDGHVKWEPRR
ncbi:MAG: hypothetical protein ACK4RG_05590 [Fimbriimonadales bacterium]